MSKNKSNLSQISGFRKNRVHSAKTEFLFFVTEDLIDDDHQLKAVALKAVVVMESRATFYVLVAAVVFWGSCRTANKGFFLWRFMCITR